ncbi:MAG: HNH endonuclease signature motif containing protein [Kineosporiaceae bacterium]
MTCEVDHRIPYSDGGATCECNLHPLCKHHHRLRERGFTPTLVDPGTGMPITQWVTPTGRTIRTETEHPPFWRLSVGSLVEHWAWRWTCTAVISMQPDGSPKCRLH